MELIATTGTRSKDQFYVHWNLGKRCNFDCVYCPDSLHDMTSQHKTYEQLCNIAKKLEDNVTNPYIRVWFTGGEPTVNPNFLKFCQYLNTRPRFILGLNSNASRTKEYYLELSEYVESLQFSSHFEFCDDEKFKNTALALHEKIEGRFSINLMMEPEFWDRAVNMVEFCEKNKIKYHMKRIRAKGKAYTPPYQPEQINFIIGK